MAAADDAPSTSGQQISMHERGSCIRRRTCFVADSSVNLTSSGVTAEALGTLNLKPSGGSSSFGPPPRGKSIGGGGRGVTGMEARYFSKRRLAWAGSRLPEKTKRHSEGSLKASV